MTVRHLCYQCKRFITRTRKGNGAFRKHNIKLGVVCPGSWKFPQETKAIKPEPARSS